MNTEEWRSVPNYEGLYEVSDSGRVKSLDRRMVHNISGVEYIRKGIYLKQCLSKRGYLMIVLCKDGVNKSKKVHKLVAEVFLNHTPCGHKEVVDHVNNDKTDNRVSNLRLVTNRENTSKGYLLKDCSSSYTGVSWDKKRNKWASRAFINGKHEFIGRFNCELDASKAYQKRLKEIQSKLKQDV